MECKALNEDLHATQNFQELFMPHVSSKYVSPSHIWLWKNRNIQKQNSETYSEEIVFISSTFWLIKAASWHKTSQIFLPEKCRQGDHIIKNRITRMTINTVLTYSSNSWKTGCKISLNIQLKTRLLLFKKCAFKVGYVQNTFSNLIWTFVQAYAFDRNYCQVSLTNSSKATGASTW